MNKRTQSGLIIVIISLLLVGLSFYNWCAECNSNCAWYDLFCLATNASCVASNTICHMIVGLFASFTRIFAFVLFIIGISKLIRGE
jgi:hypothetical protein